MGDPHRRVGVVSMVCVAALAAAACTTDRTTSIDGPAVVDQTVPVSQPPSSPVDDSSTSQPAPVGTTIPPTLPIDTEPTVAPDVAHGFPFAADVNVGYAQTHSNYPATDMFADCGTPVVSPVSGVVDQLRRDNAYDPAVDDPATRGGKFVSIIGDDGARYYMAHFTEIEASLVVGARITVGDPVGLVGQTGRAAACHLHFALSPTCIGPDGRPYADDEWWVRRGVVWPYPYLDDWRAGGNRSPFDEVTRWLAEFPEACSALENTPFPLG